MAVKIRLKRLGKIRSPFYRVVVADSRTKRDGRVIEEIGKYNPNLQPSLIEIESERAQYWLGVGAQPSEQVLALLKVTGDWQKFKGLPGAEGTLQTPEGKSDPQEAIAAAEKAAAERREEAEKAKKAAEAEAAKAEAEAAAAAKAESEEAGKEEPAEAAESAEAEQEN